MPREVPDCLKHFVVPFVSDPAVLIARQLMRKGRIKKVAGPLTLRAELGRDSNSLGLFVTRNAVCELSIETWFGRKIIVVPENILVVIGLRNFYPDTPAIFLLGRPKWKGYNSAYEEPRFIKRTKV